MYRVAVKAIIVKNNKLLLVKDRKDTGWSFPGGGVDYGEGLEAALLRELAEEINVPKESIESDFKIVATTIGQVKSGIPRCNLHYLVTLNTDRVDQTSEINSLKWIDFGDLDNIKYESSAGDVKSVLTTVFAKQI